MTPTPSTSTPCQVEWKIVLEGNLSGTFDDSALAKSVVNKLRELSGDSSLSFESFEKGSIVLTLRGTEDGFRVIDSLFKNGELTKILGLRIEQISLISESQHLSNKDGLDSAMQKRLALFTLLSELPGPNFDAIVYAVKMPPPLMPPSVAPQGQRVPVLLDWAQSPVGCGLEKLEAVVNAVINPNP